MDDGAHRLLHRARPHLSYGDRAEPVPLSRRDTALLRRAAAAPGARRFHRDRRLGRRARGARDPRAAGRRAALHLLPERGRRSGGRPVPRGDAARSGRFHEPHDVPVQQFLRELQRVRAQDGGPPPELAEAHPRAHAALRHQPRDQLRHQPRHASEDGVQGDHAAPQETLGLRHSRQPETRGRRARRARGERRRKPRTDHGPVRRSAHRRYLLARSRSRDR